MKNILAAKLKVGDIFAKEVKLQGREAFVVIGETKSSILANSRLDTSKVKSVKRIDKDSQIILLKAKKS